MARLYKVAHKASIKRSKEGKLKTSDVERLTMGPTPAGISYKFFGIPNGIWNLALESGILRLVEIQNSRNSPDLFVNSLDFSEYFRALL